MPSLILCLHYCTYYFPSYANSHANYQNYFILSFHLYWTIINSFPRSKSALSSTVSWYKNDKAKATENEER